MTEPELKAALVRIREDVARVHLDVTALRTRDRLLREAEARVAAAERAALAEGPEGSMAARVNASGRAWSALGYLRTFVRREGRH